MKSIASAAKNISVITSFDENFEQLSMNIIMKIAKFEPEPTFENTINEIRANHLKNITSIGTNVSYIN